MSSPPHARAFDLPGWPCPPRVRDIAMTEKSWGEVYVGRRDNDVEQSGVVQDEVGRLWANGDMAPKFAIPTKYNDLVVGAVLFWTEEGIGVYVHPARYSSLPSLNSYDMAPDKWVPIVVALGELPDFVHEHGD